ncbi:STAS domain-containing protein [Vibrio hannami]|uniref:STAS domain-containing protein n=1 Tax=Vibrio hannami TaxID=2717094 RepID=UPI00241093D2|nr:STAS domain-containing protein [Vibrio hannami]MDG3087916.1 STAS domain-containing protein [Vibrio hannami]
MTTFLLPQEITIYEVADIYAELLAVISQSDSLELDGKAVEELDTSGLQLLLWSRNECRKIDIQWKLTSPSDELSQCLELAGFELSDSDSGEAI